MRYNAFINSNTELQQYCCKVLALTKTNSNHLEMAHHQWLKRILHVSWKDMVSNEEVRKRRLQKILQQFIGRLCLRWFGHTIRMQENRLVKRTLSWELEQKRRHTRQYTTWKDSVMFNIWTSAGKTWQTRRPTEATGAAGLPYVLCTGWTNIR